MDDHLKPDDVDWRVQQRVTDERHEGSGHDQGNVQDEHVLKTQLQVAKQLPAFTNRMHDRAEVVIEQHNRCDLARAARPALTHRDADIGGLKRRYVVDAVTCHCDDFTRLL